MRPLFLLTVLAASTPALATDNPRTVVALEDTHFRAVQSDPKDLLLDILGTLAFHDGATEMEVAEDYDLATLKAHVATLVLTLPDDLGGDDPALRPPCGGWDNVTGGWGYVDGLGQHHEVWICGNGSAEHYVDGDRKNLH